jgi:acyl carrier protein
MTQLAEDDILAFLLAHAAETLEMTPADLQRIDRNTPIVEGLRLDSLRQVLLVTGVEERFGFVFEPEELERLSSGTIGDLMRVIQERAASTQAS